MSAITTPSNDLLARLTGDPTAASPFTTFAAGHFVRPAASAQPVAQPFAFGLCDVFAAAPLDLDYDEPNAVCDGDVELVNATGSVHQLAIPAADAA
jgi:hypothetical protein